jgi:hypothetical protein
MGSPGVKRYQDFDVFIDRSGKGYRVHIDSPTGQASTKISPRDAARIEALREEFSRLSLLRADELVALGRAKELGGLLYKSLFAGNVGHLFASSVERTSGRGEGLRIRLRRGGALALESPKKLADAVSGRRGRLRRRSPGWQVPVECLASF